MNIRANRPRPSSGALKRLLAGNAVIVTGAGSGLGRAYALGIAAVGGAVVVGDIDGEGAAATAAVIRDAGGRAVAVEGSVGDWQVAEHLSTVALASFGRLDGLVANAAVTHHAAPWDEDEQALRSIVEVNVLGVQFAARHAMRAMVESSRSGAGGGSIVTVVSGAQFGIPGMSAYGATKGAVTAMTANWAHEGAPHGIRVNALSPLGDTAMSRADPRPDRPPLPDPMRIAPVVIALLSSATAPLTGTTVRFDGTMLSTHPKTPPQHIETRSGWSVPHAVDTLRRLAATNA